MENRNKSPRRGPGGHGPMGGGNFEKAKDFKGAVKRLLKEVRGFRALIVFSLILAALGSVLSILAPNKLSLLTDEITKGLVINSSNLETLSKEVSSSLNEEKLATILPNIIKIDLPNDTIKNIMSSSEINEEEKKSFEDFLKTISSEKEKVFQNITQLPDSILNHLLKGTTYNGVTITSQDQITFLNMIKNMEDKTKEIVFPDSIANVLFQELEIDGVKVSKIDQARFIEIMSTLKEEATSSEIYKKIDQMPESIRKITEPFMDIEKIKKIALFLSILYIASALFTYIESISMTNVANKFAKSLRSRISKKINLLPLKYFDSNQTGDLLSRVTNDVDTIAQSMNQSLATLVSAITLFIGSIIMMFYTNWIMAITAILASLFGFSFMFMILGKSQKYFVARQKELGNLNGHIEEIYSGLNVVKAYNGKQDADLKFDTYNKNVYEANRKSQFLSGLMMPLMNFIGNFGYVAVCIVGALLAMSGHISFGVIVAFIAYVRLFTSPLSQIAQAMTSLQSTLAASERVFELFD